MRMLVRSHVCIHALHVCLNVGSYVYLVVWARLSTCIYKYIYVCIYIYRCVYIYIYVVNILTPQFLASWIMPNNMSNI